MFYSAETQHSIRNLQVWIRRGLEETVKMKYVLRKRDVLHDFGRRTSELRLEGGVVLDVTAVGVK